MELPLEENELRAGEERKLLMHAGDAEKLIGWFLFVEWIDNVEEHLSIRLT